MDKRKIADFFDRCAPWWDDDMVRNEVVITTILDNAGIDSGIHVLDVACGTGVLFPDYFKRGVESVTGIDISPEMAKIAQSKFPEATVICGDVEDHAFDRKFDAIMVYNAFPHFPDPEALIRVLAELVEPGGRLSIAHGMSRAQLRQHHAGRASEVSIDLLHEKDLAALLAPYFDVDVVISNHRMYQVAGTRREGTIHSHGGHSHAHAHSDVHDHSHHGGHSHCDSDTPMEELLALMKYMVTHNDTHAQEMAELAMKIRDAGKHRAYEKIMDAVADFDILNAKFDAVLKELTQ
ncbi:MAG: class I SAM-dependent methyltransferase [Oscillospiraceae bacterium]|nr:class I SAM-dependent methyltransferase [Oscillospiraceae bacterium]